MNPNIIKHAAVTILFEENAETKKKHIAETLGMIEQSINRNISDPFLNAKYICPLQYLPRAHTNMKKIAKYALDALLEPAHTKAICFIRLDEDIAVTLKVLFEGAIHIERRTVTDRVYLDFRAVA